MVGGLGNVAVILASLLKNLFSNTTRFCDCYWYIHTQTDMALCAVTVCSIKLPAYCHLSTHHTCTSEAKMFRLLIGVFFFYQTELWDVGAVKEESINEITVEEHEVSLGR